MPLVSVVVPTHNRPQMLAEALESVRAQTFADYEIIIVSNGETAENRAHSQSAAIRTGARWFALNEGNVSAARNFGVEQARGEWIAFLDDDDLWLPAKLACQLNAADRAGADMVSCDLIASWPDGHETIDAPRIPAGWTPTQAISAYVWGAQPSCAIVRRSAFTAVGGFDPRQKVGEESDLWRRISWHHMMHHVEEGLVRYRRGHQSLGSYARRTALYDLRHLIKMRRDTPHDLRHTLPSLARILRLLLPRLCYIATPHSMRTWLRPRQRLLALRERWQSR